MQIDFYQLQKDCIELGIIKVSDVDGSHVFNANLTKIYTIVQLYLGKQAQTDREGHPQFSKPLKRQEKCDTQAVSGANNRSRP